VSSQGWDARRWARRLGGLRRATRYVKHNTLPLLLQPGDASTDALALGVKTHIEVRCPSGRQSRAFGTDGHPCVFPPRAGLYYLPSLVVSRDEHQ
jgi:hypothetical protein